MRLSKKTFVRSGLLLAVICVLINLQTVTKVSAQSFGEITNLNGTLHGSQCPVIGVSGNNIFVAWNSFAIGDGDILFSKSSDGGETFSAPIDLSTSPEQSECPEMAVSGSNIYIVWAEATSSSLGFPIFFRSSFDGGATFNQIKQIGDSEFTDETSTPQVSASGKKSFVIWTHDTPTKGAPIHKVLFRRTLDGGKTFSNVKNLITDSKIDAIARPTNGIAVSGSNVYVGWEGRNSDLSKSDAYLRVSTNDGKDFGSTRNLSNDGHSGIPKLRVSESNVFVVWESDKSGNSDILFRKSTNKGLSFNTVKNLSNTKGNSFDPLLHTSSETIYLVWTEGQTGDIFFRRSTDSGNHFGSRINLSNNAGASNEVAISRDGNNLNIVWVDSDGILFRRTIDKGVNFQDVINLSEGNRGSDPKISSTGGNVFVTWTNFENVFFRGTGGQSASQNLGHILIPLPN